MNSIYTNILLSCLFMIGSFYFYLYIIWSKSNYRKQSQYWFFKVHISIYIENIPKIFRVFFKKYFWLYWEYHIYRVLEKIPWNNKILTNIFLPQWITVTDTEVDIIFIHGNGVYVIESKDFGWWIFGDIFSKNWIQSFWRKYKFQFYNPLFQNKSHVESIGKLIPEYRDSIHPLVVFSNRCTIKIESPLKMNILQLKDLREIIKNWTSTLKEQDINNIYERIYLYQGHTNEQEDIHNDQINNLISI